MSGDEPQLSQGKRAATDPSLPLQTEVIPVRGWAVRQITVPVDKSQPEPIKGHYYVMGICRGAGHCSHAVIDASLKMVSQVARYTQLSWGQHIEIVRDAYHHWGCNGVLVDTSNGGDSFAENLQGFLLPARKHDVSKSRAVGLALEFFSAVEYGRCILAVRRPLEPLWFTSVDYDGRTGKPYLHGIDEHDKSMLTALSLAWYLASTSMVSFGIAPLE
jgi:hypothetical protein